MSVYFSRSILAFTWGVFAADAAPWQVPAFKSRPASPGLAGAASYPFIVRRIARRFTMQCMKTLPVSIGCHMSVRPYLTAALFALAASALLPVVSGDSASAAGYPDRIVRIVVPFAPGGGTDVVARTLAQEMAKDLGVGVVIENRPGAGTIVGTQAVSLSAPDGYTLLMGTFANAVNPSLHASLPYDPHKDLQRWRWWRAPSTSSWSIRNRRSDRSPT